MSHDLYPAARVIDRPNEHFAFEAGTISLIGPYYSRCDAERLALCWNALRRVSDADLQRAQGDGIAWVTKREAEFVEKIDDILGILIVMRGRDGEGEYRTPANIVEKIDEILLLQ